MSNNTTGPVDKEIREIYALFFDGNPITADIIDTSREEGDFRQAVLIRDIEDKQYVLKITANDFTFSDKILVWQKAAKEYRDLGYYCPQIFSDKKGAFPTVRYQGHDCVVYAEEYSVYKSLEDRAACDEDQEVDSSRYFDDIWSMTAKIAAKNLDFTEYPSAYCLFETFCSSDETDEVLENALEWKKCASFLPEEFSAQVQRIWDNWCKNREVLKVEYDKLPTSVFQADLNPTNLLIDENGDFKGIYDFNLCGKDVFLNYLMRENFGDFEKEIEKIFKALEVSSKYYTFSEIEKELALPLYRCLKPLWFIRVQELKNVGDDREAIKKYLDNVEYYLTKDIDFKGHMRI